MTKEAREIVVKLRDIYKNPYRDYSIYPISKEKVEELIASIKLSGYWGTISGRQRTDGKVEISFGHHRLEALKLVFGDDYPIKISVCDLSDSEMVSRMCGENDDAYNCSLAAIDDAVKAARNYLQEHEDEAREFVKKGMPEVQRFKLGAPIIARFSNKKITTVQKSLERLNLIESGAIEGEALHKFPSTRSCEAFVRAVVQFGIKKEDQILAANIIEQGKRFGERSIYDVIMTYRRPDYKQIQPDEAIYCETRLVAATKEIRKAAKDLQDLIDGFSGRVIYGGGTTIDDISEKAQDDFQVSLKYLSEKVKKIQALFERRDKDMTATQ